MQRLYRSHYISCAMGSNLKDDIKAFALHRLRWQTAISREQYQRYHTLLSNTSRFYRELSTNGQAKAMHRIVHFMRAKKFIGHGIEVTDTHRLLISLAAIKLTFGLEHHLLPHLHTIYLRPTQFYSSFVRADVKGLASGSGELHLSWQHVLEGMADADDGLHLAIHEMAHILKIDTVKGKPQNERFAFYLNTWMREADRIRQNQPDDPFLRKYAQVNLHEFFAVCMENFIERPDDFAAREPHLFYHTCYLLNQYPLEPKDRALTPDILRRISHQVGISFPVTPAKDYTHHNWHWSYTLLFISPLFAPIAILILSEDVMFPFGMFGAWMLASLLCAPLLYRQVVTYRAMTRDFYPVFLLVGAGPMALAFALMLDSTVDIMEWEEQHPIVNIQHWPETSTMQLQLADNALADWPDQLTMLDNDAHIIQQHGGAHLRLRFTRGLLGIRHCIASEIVFSAKANAAVETH
ncbi:MAG: zinc-dependent peptidase [Flavobacteriales bacterium]|nr:zinc-dependent peptidase [Flavobacteriales bacterium]